LFTKEDDRGRSSSFKYSQEHDSDRNTTQAIGSLTEDLHTGSNSDVSALEENSLASKQYSDIVHFAGNTESRQLQQSPAKLQSQSNNKAIDSTTMTRREHRRRTVIHPVSSQLNTEGLPTSPVPSVSGINKSNLALYLPTTNQSPIKSNVEPVILFGDFDVVTTTGDKGDSETKFTYLTSKNGPQMKGSITKERGLKDEQPSSYQPSIGTLTDESTSSIQTGGTIKQIEISYNNKVSVYSRVDKSEVIIGDLVANAPMVSTREELTHSHHHYASPTSDIAMVIQRSDIRPRAGTLNPSPMEVENVLTGNTIIVAEQISAPMRRRNRKSHQSQPQLSTPEQTYENEAPASSYPAAVSSDSTILPRNDGEHLINAESSTLQKRGVSENGVIDETITVSSSSVTNANRAFFTLNEPDGTRGRYPLSHHLLSPMHNSIPSAESTSPFCGLESDIDAETDERDFSLTVQDSTDERSHSQTLIHDSCMSVTDASQLSYDSSEISVRVQTPKQRRSRSRKVLRAFQSPDSVQVVTFESSNVTQELPSTPPIVNNAQDESAVNMTNTLNSPILVTLQSNADGLQETMSTFMSTDSFCSEILSTSVMQQSPQGKSPCACSNGGFTHTKKSNKQSKHLCRIHGIRVPTTEPRVTLVESFITLYPYSKPPRCNCAKLINGCHYSLSDDPCQDETVIYSRQVITNTYANLHKTLRQTASALQLGIQSSVNHDRLLEFAQSNERDALNIMLREIAMMLNGIPKQNMSRYITASSINVRSIKQNQIASEGFYFPQAFFCDGIAQIHKYFNIVIGVTIE